ncbi:MAG: class I SAM-dependent methyltransferase [Armatimonadota bacterium]
MSDGRHDHWAGWYDAVYAAHFGSFLDALTRRNTETILALAQDGETVIDYGAGTGRLSVPLLDAGRRVIAVDPSMGMLDQLRAKAGGHPNLRCLHGTIAEARVEPPGQCDAAVCVFTVLAYLLEEVELSRSFNAMATALKPGGRLLLDIPGRGLFGNGGCDHGGIERHVDIVATDDEGRFEYRERTRIRDAQSTGAPATVDYVTKFPLRWWPRSTVEACWTRAGFALETDLSASYRDSGAEYVVLRRIR